MPGRNLEKMYLEDSYYHIYNRGVNKEKVFRDDEDFAVFLNLLKRYLSKKTEKDNKGRKYPSFAVEIELVAFCLMPNHFHLLVYQKQETGMTHLLRAVISSYGVYFNRKYRRVGPLFQGRFKASYVNKQEYLDHVSRYIHLNPGRDKYRTWQPSSYQYYSGEKHANWLNTQLLLDMFSGRESYLTFVADYAEMHDELDALKHELADK